MKTNNKIDLEKIKELDEMIKFGNTRREIVQRAKELISDELDEMIKFGNTRREIVQRAKELISDDNEKENDKGE